MAIAKFCPECGAAVAGAKFCPECGASTALGIAQPEATPVVLGHEEQVEILQRAIAELRTQGWKVYKQQPTPYEVCLVRKTGLTARQFLPLWVEEDGTLQTNEVLEGGRIQIVPFVFFPVN
jgi:hypothetical protein